MRTALHGDAALDGATARISEPDRAQPPIRWPHPTGMSVAFFAAWLLGGVFALFVPAMIVGPGEENAPAGQVWLAFSMSVIGALVMVGASIGLWRRTKDSGALVLCIPAVAIVFGGVILAAVKLAVGTPIT
jgi:hypothetical protein